MSMNFGPIRQIGHVVRDADAAMEYWTQVLGIGPFFVMKEIPLKGFRYRGQQSPDPVVTLCFGQSGDVQIELIEQHDDAPSAYREFLSAGRTGVQHVSTWFSDPEEYDAARQRALEKGLTLVHESVEGPGRFVYFETGRPDAPLIEFSEATHPDLGGFPDMVAEASRDWDGTDPVRILG